MKYLIIRLYHIMWILPIRSLKLMFVRDYTDLYHVALWEIKRLSVFGPVCMVSAPLFSGGTGAFKENLRILAYYIYHLRNENKIVWSQVPYLDVKIKKWARNIQFNTSQKINDFYLPIIKSSNIAELICTSGNHSFKKNYYESNGCKAEREAAVQQNLKVTNYFNEKFHN